MSGQSATSLLRHLAALCLSCVIALGIGATASATTPDYPPEASIDPILPTTTTPSSGTTAKTGTDSTRSGVLIGVGALGLGGGLVTVSRRRRHGSART